LTRKPHDDTRPTPDDLPKRAGRSHPPSLLKLAERTIRDEALLSRGDVVVCACSGGPDSTALLHVLALLMPRVGHRVEAIGVDHGLRPEAASELRLAEDLASSLGVPFRAVRVNVAPGSNLQARARAARLAALHEGAIAAGARAVATGHTADDRAETFLLRLLRGAGPRGLAVLPPRAPFPPTSLDSEPIAGRAPQTPDKSPPLELIRPLLFARRSDVLAHLHRHHIPFAQDPSNLDPRFTRVRVRRELLPLLEELSPKIVDHLGALAAMLDREHDRARDLDRDHDKDSREIASPMRLGRAQRQAVERATRLGRASMRLRVKGNRELIVAFPDGRIVLIEEE
jgi:tRNA(Ile)-lysidine synthase